MNKNLSTHSQYSLVILAEAMKEILKHIQVPTIWNTHRQAGKSTVLANITAQEILDLKSPGDVWVITPNLQSDMLFFEKVERVLPKDEGVRKTRGRLEIISTFNRLVAMRSLSNITTGGSFEQPKLIIIDEAGHIDAGTYAKLDKLLKDTTKRSVRIIGATTGGHTDYFPMIKSITGSCEIISTGMNSVKSYYDMMENFHKEN